MTNLQEMIYNVIPQNILDKSSMSELLNIFFKVVDDTCKIAADLPEYINIETDVLADDIMKIYLQNIYKVLKDVEDDVLETGIGGIPHDERKNYCYSDLNLGLQDANDTLFVNNLSTGLHNVDLEEEIVIQDFFNGVSHEYNKKFILKSKLGVTHLTTIEDVTTSGQLVPSELCCSTIPCAVSVVPTCTLNPNLNSFINSYVGNDLAIEILNQVTAPGSVTDCISKSPLEDNATETPYKVGSNWMHIDFYVGQDYIDNQLSLSVLSELSKKINEEHIWSSKNFKQNLGHAKAFYFTYNIIKEVKLDTGSSYFNDMEYMELEEMRTQDGSLMPFNYIVKSLIHEYIYNNVVQPIAHPVGFNGIYKRVLGFNFNDNFCKLIEPDYDAYFIYCINNDTYFDIRTGDGLFGDNGLTAQHFRYNTEIQDLYIFEQHNKAYIRITLTNGYSYRKNFDDSLVLFDNTGIIVKSFNKSCGLSPVKSRIKHIDPTFYIETVNNERDDFNTTDPVTNIKADDVYRIDFNNDGVEEGGYLSNQHTIIYLNNNVQYHIANSRIIQIDSTGNKYNSLDGYSMLYNGLEQSEIVLCKDVIFWDITMKMIDNDKLPHYIIVQEPIPNTGYLSPKSEDIDRTLRQHDNNQNLNSYIESYIGIHGNTEELAYHIINELNNPGPINFLYSSLQGMELNNNDIPEYIEYNVPNQNWGWTVGERVNGDSLINPNITDINTYINNYTGTKLIKDLFLWLHVAHSEQHDISPRFGEYETVGDHFHINNTMTQIIGASLDSTLTMNTDELTLSIGHFLNENLLITDNLLFL